MQKWEYLGAWVNRNGGVRGIIPPELTFKDGSKIQGWDEIFDYFNKIGKQGWELVSAADETRSGFTYEWLFVFKRPIESGKK